MKAASYEDLKQEVDHTKRGIAALESAFDSIATKKMTFRLLKRLARIWSAAEQSPFADAKKKSSKQACLTYFLWNKKV